MNTTIINMTMFVMGAAVGSLVTWKIMRSRCEKIIRDEVDSFAKDWSQRMKETESAYNPGEGDDEWIDDDEEDDDDDEYFDDSVIHDYHTIAGRYTNEEGGEDEVPYINGPYVIAPEDCGGGEFRYNVQPLTYYADGILADDWGIKLDIDETIGEDSLDHFGDYAEEVVHVRNERNELDYEVTLDPRRYVDVVVNDSHMSMYAN